MMQYVLAAVATIIFLGFSRAVVRRPPIAVAVPDYESTRAVVQRLLVSGEQSDHLTIEHVSSKRRIQFRKYIRGEGEYGLTLEILAAFGCSNPDAVLRTYHSKLRDVLDRGPSFPRVGDAKLKFDVGRDLGGIVEFAARLFSEVLDVSLNENFSYSPAMVTVTDEIVDSPTHRPFSSMRGWKEVMSYHRATKGITPGALMRFGTVQLIDFGALVALIIGLWIHNHSWDAIPAVVGDVPLRIRVFDLVCIAVIAVAQFTMLYMDGFWWHFRSRRNPAMPRLVRRPSGWKVFSGMMLRANLMWVIIIALVALSWIQW